MSGLLSRAVVLTIAGSIMLLGAYVLGRKDGAAVVRSAERQQQLQANRVELAALTARIQDAARAKIAAAARVPVAERHYQAARARIAIVDTNTVRVDSGPVLELPPPVITTIARGDTLVTELRAQVIAEQQWGVLWQQKAELLQTRVGLLESELADHRKASRRAQLKAAIVGAGVGVLAAITLSR